MSADNGQAETAIKVAVLCGLFACSGMVLAEETEAPDLEFLEYLGSWEESDEDWMLFARDDGQQKESEDKDGKDPAPDGEKLAELDDDN